MESPKNKGERLPVEGTSDLSARLGAELGQLKEENRRLLMANRDCIAWYEDTKTHMDRYREALEHIVKHMEITAGGMAPVSSIYVIATKALSA